MDKKIWWIIGTGAIVLVAIFAFAWSGGITGFATKDNTMTIPLSEITDTATFYESTISGKTVSFFAVKADDGSIKTGFDACDVCHETHKGYRQVGSYMICNNCGNRYPIQGLGTENKNPGGCWPGYLPSKIDGDNLVIETSDIKDGAWRF